MSELSGSSPAGGQRYSLFQGSDAAETALKAWHAPYADAFRGAEDVLDLGCGPGYFLDLLRERGVRAVGIDIDPAMAASAARRGHDARAGDQRMLATFRAAFGGIHLSHVIEHLWGDDAVALLEAAHVALRDGGILIVRTPNWGNATVRHGGFWMDHTHKRPYPLELLTKILGDIGFEIVRSGYETHGWEDTYLIARKPLPGAARTRIDWYGDFLGDGSLARVNRNLARAALALGSVEIVPFGEPTPEVDAVLGISTQQRLHAAETAPAIVLRHRWPARFMNPPHGRYVHMQPWEFGSAPRQWVERLGELADDVWCYSNHVRDGYVAAGIPPERVHVVPLGFDPAIYNADALPIPTDNPDACVFLFVGGLVPRKGLAKLVEAYAAAFTNRDPVALLIKHDPTLGQYDDAKMVEELRGLHERTDIPAIRFIESHASDAEMARLYRTATALIHPYRGEGFGLPVLEAMACGIPVVVSRGGSTDDFVDESVGYPIPAARASLGRIVNEVELAGEGWWLEPSTDALVAALRRILANRDEARAKGAAAAARAHGSWTWTHAAHALLQRVDALAQTAPHIRPAAYRDELNAYEWHGFSQNGEDGMLLELFSRLHVTDPYFVEFGVESGMECNARLLAHRYGWSGLMLEGDVARYEQLRANYADSPRVRTARAFVTRENIVELFEQHGVPAEFDLLSIDVDGNDYYLWEALAGYRPRVVVIEINAAYPPPQRWVMAYNPTHTWGRDDYYGASLASYAALGERLGYALLATDLNCVNAIFIRRDLLAASGFAEKTPEQAFNPPRYRHAHREGPALEL